MILAGAKAGSPVKFDPKYTPATGTTGTGGNNPPGMGPNRGFGGMPNAGGQSSGGRTVVTWERNGHTCVLSSTDVPRDTLLDLAGWHGKGELPF